MVKIMGTGEIMLRLRQSGLNCKNLKESNKKLRLAPSGSRRDCTFVLFRNPVENLPSFSHHSKLLEKQRTTANKEFLASNKAT